ncbi:hypothetical protein I7I50_03717 [Histoplasma capsulatum G186AR]|uniref:Uncharacterized protein n=1 Tax=Ajellomyces capsulatus TaxID=5037 RepID=A0A8H8CWP1_AJECA|nr:hypothetical protein I7I52_04624 [Histoplasma capsulatum]QSS74792.1 hypothetical protein I7I50_03717 [Histoplasma capsulatum G186AR]
MPGVCGLAMIVHLSPKTTHNNQNCSRRKSPNIVIRSQDNFQPIITLHEKPKDKERNPKQSKKDDESKQCRFPEPKRGPERCVIPMMKCSRAGSF